MPQQEKITKKLDFDKRARIEGVRILAKAANYSVDSLLDSGSYIAADNSSQLIFFTLPAVASCNGHYWNFFAANTGKFQIVAATNVLVSDYGVATKAVNFGHGKEGEGCRIICDGTKFYLVGVNPLGSAVQVNVSYQQG